METGAKKQKKFTTTKEHSYSIPHWLLQGTPVILTLLGALFYAPSLRYDFQFDDIANITRQFSIRHGTFWTLFMTGPRWMSYWLNTIHYSIGKFNPWSYRLGNLCIHTITAILLFYLIFIMLNKIKKDSFFLKNSYAIAFMTAGLFLLHPVQTQTVSYVIQGQLEGMAALFIIAALVSFFYAATALSAPLRIMAMMFSLVSAFFASGCKEIAIVLPALALLMDWIFIAQGSLAHLKSRWLPHCSLTFVIVSLYIYFLKFSFFVQLFGLSMEARNNIGNILTTTAEQKILPFPFLISQFKVILHYLQIFIWPFNISVEYDWKLVKGIFAIDCLLPFLVLAALAYIAWHFLRRDTTNPIVFGLLWFIISVAPRSSIIPSSELLSDYKTYVPSVGICFLLATCLTQLLLIGWRSLPQLASYQQRWHTISLLMVLMPIGFASYQRNKVWRTGEEFWLNIIHNAPEKARAYNNYAVALSEKGSYKEAIPFFQRAIAMDKTYPDPLNNIAVAYSVVDELDKGIEALKQSIMINPQYPEAYNNLASFLIKQNKPDQAEHMLKVALQLRPYYGKAFFNLGKVYLMRNNPEEAHNYIKKSCMDGDFDNATGYKAYAEMSVRLHKIDEAIIAYTKLIEIEPVPENIFGLANSLFMADKWDEAIKVYEKLVQLAPNDARFWYNLGEAYLKVAHFEKALVALDKAAPLKASIPTICLRRAYCFDQLGRKADALTSVQEALKYPNLPAQHRQVAQSMVEQAQKEGWTKI